MKSAVLIGACPPKTVFAFIVLTIMTVLTVQSGDLFAAQGKKLRIQTHKTVYVDHEKVRLQDIAKITGTDTSAIGMAGKIVVGKSPLPGKERIVRLDYLKIRLKQNRLDPDLIDMGNSGDVLVKRGFVEISTQKITRLVSNFIKNHMPWDEKEANIKKINVSSGIKLPKGKITHKIYPSKNNDYLGLTNICVAFYVNGKIYRKVWVSAYIQVFTRVLVAARPLGKYQPITGNDVNYKVMDLSNIPSNAVKHMDDVVGKRTSRVIYPQTVISEDKIENPPLIRRGDLVTITAASNGLKITATGVAKQLGRKGEMVKVVNIDSNKTIYAFVTGSGTVSVKF